MSADHSSDATRSLEGSRVGGEASNNVVVRGCFDPGVVLPPMPVVRTIVDALLRDKTKDGFIYID